MFDKEAMNTIVKAAVISALGENTTTAVMNDIVTHLLETKVNAAGSDRYDNFSGQPDTPLLTYLVNKEIRKVIENAVVEYIKTHTGSITASVQKEIRSTIESIESVDRIDVPFIIKLDDDRIDMVSEKIIQIENLLSELEKIITEDSVVQELNFDPNPFLSLIKLKKRTVKLRDRLIVRYLEVGFPNKDLAYICQISPARISQIKQNYLDSRQDKYRR